MRTPSEYQHSSSKPSKERATQKEQDSRAKSKNEHNDPHFKEDQGIRSLIVRQLYTMFMFLMHPPVLIGAAAALAWLIYFPWHRSIHDLMLKLSGKYLQYITSQLAGVL